jgi:arsenate reductase
MSDQRPAVLFLCSANSCRSQMAEAFLRKRAGDHFEVLSAGLGPASDIHPMARKVMEEVGLDLDGQYPKAAKEYLGEMLMRYVIVVCGDTEEQCPRIWPGVTEHLYWPFDDPAMAKGTEDERLAEFRRVRDEIEGKINQWLVELAARPDPRRN